MHRRCNVIPVLLLLWFILFFPLFPDLYFLSPPWKTRLKCVTHDPLSLYTGFSKSELIPSHKLQLTINNNC